MADKYSIYNDKPSVMIQINSSITNPEILPIIKIRTYEDIMVQGWGHYVSFTNNNLSYPYISGNSTHTVSEIGGTGKSILSVGAYCTKNTWTSYKSYTYDYGPLAVIDSIAFFSSKGPTADGRIKPDIVCPGYGVVSSYNTFFNAAYPPSYYKTFTIPFQGKVFYFGILQGTSIATPLLTGTIALWLEKNPTLTLDQIKEILHTKIGRAHV